MKKVTLYIVFAMGIAAIASSCKKHLDALPTQARVEGAVVMDQKSAEASLNGVYNRFAHQSSVRSTVSTTWYTFHEILPSSLAGWIQYAFGRSDIENFATLTPGSTNFYWTAHYNILNAANVTITETEALADSKFTGSRKKEILAEARFLRAYAHFSLLTYFSEWFDVNSPRGVLLRKEPLKLSNAAQKRSTVKESYDYIIEDVNYAITNAADVRPNYYVNKTAARALKMKALMMRGQGTDYADIITLANQIMSNPAYELEPNLRDLFQVKGLTSKEVILGVTPFPGQTARQGTYDFIQSGVYLSTPEFRALLANDPRRTWMYRAVGTSNATMATRKDSTYLSKYFGPRVEDCYVLRLTEVHLSKAEAIVRSGGSLTEARNILKNVMSKAGVTDFTQVDDATTSALLLIEIAKEFQRNLVAENGADWLALIRLPLATIKQIRPAVVDQRQLMLPIPLTEFQLNPTIGEQNTGYPRQ